MPSIHVYVSHSSEETKKIAQGFAEELKKSDVLCLYGDLGNGKTTFVQGLAKGLGIKKRVISPTFTIVRTYEIKLKSQSSKVKNTRLADLPRRVKAGALAKRAGQNSKVFYHIDLYRTQSENDVKSIGLEEMLNDKSAIVAIEWAEKIKDLLPEKRWDIYFEYVFENERKIEIKKLNKF